MPPDDAEVIDLTQDSPIRGGRHHFIELDSEGEVVGESSKPPTNNGKVNRRKRKKPRKKVKELEEGEVTQTSVDVSREQSPDGSKKTEESGNKARSSKDTGAQVATVKPLSERLSSPRAINSEAVNGYGRDDEPVKEKSRRPRIRRDRYAIPPPPKEDHRRRSRSPDRLRNSRDAQPSEKQPQTRQDGDSGRRRRERSPQASQTTRPESLFFEDVVRSEVPSTAKIQEMPSQPLQPVHVIQESTASLLLPAHVSVIDQDAVVDQQQAAPPPESDSEEEDYIEYLDYDDDRKAPGMVRYFETVDEDDKAVKPKTVVCKKCGAEGEHRTYECPVIICLTCGARDEHPTRSCPISKTCFNCGMKGHVSKACPKPYNRAGPSQYDECDRCGSRRHNTNECPTLWRLYDYVDDAERQVILQVREQKRVLPLGQGGEGYIATDEWCYNCGSSGHLGDDCRDIPHVPDFPREPSAFSLYNTLAGPFADPDARPARSSTKRPPRDWEVAGAFADGYGAQLPMDVGKQGRRKERARMEQRSREYAEQQDDDDWFGRQAKGRGGGDNATRGSWNGGGDKKISFNLPENPRRDYDDARRRGGRDRRPYDDYLPGPSRETDSIQIRGAAKYEERGGGRYASIRAKDRDRKDARRREDRGPRYKGSYAR